MESNLVYIPSERQREGAVEIKSGGRLWLICVNRSGQMYGLGSSYPYISPIPQTSSSESSCNSNKNANTNNANDRGERLKVEPDDRRGSGSGSVTARVPVDWVMDMTWHPNNPHLMVTLTTFLITLPIILPFTVTFWYIYIYCLCVYLGHIWLISY